MIMNAKHRIKEWLYINFARSQIVQLAVNLENFQEEVRKRFPQAVCKVRFINWNHLKLVVFKSYLPGCNVPFCPANCVNSHYWCSFGGHPWGVKQAMEGTIKWDLR